MKETVYIVVPQKPKPVKYGAVTYTFPVAVDQKLQTGAANQTTSVIKQNDPHHPDRLLVFKCNICGQKFTDISSMSAHRTLHFDNHLFTCNDCGLMCSSAEQLSAHVVVHNIGAETVCGEKNQVEPDPRYGIGIEKVNLQRLTKKPNPKRHKCPVCDKKFAMRHNLKQHMLTHAETVEADTAAESEVSTTDIKTSEERNSELNKKIKDLEERLRILPAELNKQATDIDNLKTAIENLMFPGKTFDSINPSLIERADTFNHLAQAVTEKLQMHSGLTEDLAKWLIDELTKKDHGVEKCGKDLGVPGDPGFSSTPAKSADVSGDLERSSKSAETVGVREDPGDSSLTLTAAETAGVSGYPGTSSKLAKTVAVPRDLGVSLMSTWVNDTNHSDLTSDIASAEQFADAGLLGTDSMESWINVNADGPPNLFDTEDSNLIDKETLDHSYCVKSENCDPVGLPIGDFDSKKYEDCFSKADFESATLDDGSLKCTICERRFILKRHLASHMLKTHGNKKPSKCKSCGKMLYTAIEVIAHERKHKGLKPYKCRYCEKEFTKWESLTGHERLHSGERPFICTICGKGFCYEPNLRRHIRTHKEGKRFLCNVCGKGFTSNFNLQNHIVLHTGEKRHTCKVCKETFLRYEYFIQHTKSHKEYKSTCKICHASFLDESELLEHIRNEHPTMKYSCHVCTKRFADLPQLVEHMAMHGDTPPHVCEKCDKGFINEDYFNGHSCSAIGVNVKPICSVCGKIFSNRAYLKSHMRIHTGERPYGCSFCGKRFVQPTHLQTHIKTHTGQQDYQCEICGRKFAAKHNMIEHIRIHSNEVPYSCKFCKKGFRHRGNMKKHIQRAHKTFDTMKEPEIQGAEEDS